MGDEQVLGTVLKALRFAAEKHSTQRRKDAEASPYINHPIGVANILFHEAGVTDPVVITAAILHDTVEDTETTKEELAREFGQRVSDVVSEVTDDKSLPKAERKRLQIAHAPHLSPEAQQVKLADKIANLRDVAACPPPDWPLERRREYFDWGKAVTDQIRGKFPRLDALVDQAYAKKP